MMHPWPSHVVCSASARLGVWRVVADPFYQWVFWVDQGCSASPRGRSSTCEQRGNCPTLTDQKCVSPVA